MAVFGKGIALVAVEPFGYEERTYSECCVMVCTPKIDGGGTADFAEQSAEQTNGRRNIAVSEAKRGKLALSLLRKGRGYIQRSRREGGAMGKEEICDMDCFRCVHPDCINERPMTRQARYYWRHRERVLAKKKEEYQKRKAEKDEGH